MKNLLTLTDFIRSLSSSGQGSSSIYLVPAGKGYDATCKSLTATAHREGVNISSSKVIVVDASSLRALEAVKVMVK